MFELLQRFEQVAMRFDAKVLVGSGLVAILLGLFIWLGGLGLRKLLAAAVGAVCGCICGVFIVGRNIELAGLFTASAAVVAVAFEKIFIAILTALLVALLGFAVLARPYCGDPKKMIPTNQERTRLSNHRLSVNETVNTTKAYMVGFDAQVKYLRSQIPLYSWVIIAALAVFFILGTYYMWHLTSALCCAILGTLLLFTGMVLLLLYKGATPITSICNRNWFYIAVFVAMTAFGTVEQLLLCKYAKKKIVRKEERKVVKIEQEPQQRRLNWRTH